MTMWVAILAERGLQRQRLPLVVLACPTAQVAGTLFQHESEATKVEQRDNVVYAVVQ